MKQIALVFGENYNAGEKARRDVYDILKSKNIEDVSCKCFYSNTFFVKLINEIKKYFFLKKLKNKKETYILQYPFSNISIVNKKVCSLCKKNDVVILIHDIEGLRFEDSERLKIEKETFGNAKYVIVHNEIMKKYLCDELEISEEKLISLEIFDYLIPDTQKNICRTFNDKTFDICYAGNLAKEKSTFLYQLKEHKMNYNLLLYGIGLSAELNGNIMYKGSFKSDELPEKMEGQFGLIWDGNWDSSDEDKGFKKYTKYNNPHKLSLYIISELPVIVWSKSAAALFVNKYNIGYIIDSIDDINTLEISVKDYNIYCNNIKKIKNKLINGEFTYNAFKEILDANN